MTGGAPELPGVTRVLDEGRGRGVARVAEAVVLRRGRPAHESPGARRLLDVASLTKPMATATLCALLVAEGRLALDAPASSLLPRFTGGGRDAVTVRQLLAHASGLPAWRPFHERAAAGGGRAAVEEALWAEPLEAAPGRRALYGDPGYMLLGLLLERLGGSPLPRLFAERVAGPLGMRDTRFASELGLEVNDENARAMGGAAGHAGLFSSAADVALLGEEWRRALEGAGRILDPSVAREFARRDATPGSERTLGWDTPSPGTSSLGSRLGRGPLGAIGHLGYTGCSLWIDRDAGLACALLTDHAIPGGRRAAEILAFRQAFHDAVAEGLGIG
jgi:CubicO group peptidase (beta-lactamase class C family)